MANYCGECAHCDTNGAPCFGEYYCEEKRKYVSKSASACSSFIKKPDNGYKRAGCYITTMACKILGLEDDCEVLTSLRHLREDYLKTFEDGINILQEYDQIGPVISNLIQRESIEYVQTLYERFLVPCKGYVEASLYPEATLIYQSMFEELKGRYGLSSGMVDFKRETPLEDLGKGRMRAKKVEC